MKTITQYKEDIAALMKKSGDIDARCVTENREITATELELKNEILDTVEEYRGIIATMERSERINAELAKPQATVTNPSVSTPRVTVESRAKDKFDSFGEQMACVYRAGLPGGRIDPRLHNISAAASGMGETVPSDGGFLVQTDISTQLLEDVFTTGILASKCQRVQISGNANATTMNGVDETSRASTRYGGIVGYWEGEADQFTGKKPKFRKIELKLKKLTGLCYATDENLEDAAQLESVIRKGFTGEFGFLLDDAIVNGTGAGQPLGYINSPALVSVAKETGQKAATVVAENIIKMYSRRFPGQTGNYVWLYNQNIEPQLFTMSLAVGTGGVPLYMPPGGLNDAPYGRLMGLPAMAIEQAATLGTVGDIVLANLPNGYILAEKGGIRSDVSIHVRFEYDESVFRFILRIDGQPVRSSALTPYKGSDTLGHFIALATRS